MTAATPRRAFAAVEPNCNARHVAAIANACPLVFAVDKNLVPTDHAFFLSASRVKCCDMM
jgi:hypothetical protein